VNRDLVFFVAGLCFGVVAGFFVFRTVLEPAGALGAPAPSAERSQIGLDTQSETGALDMGTVEQLQASAQDNPNDAEVRVQLGRAYFEAGRHEDAAAWFRAAIEIDGEHVDARSQLALSLLNLGRLDEAVATYEETLRVVPEHPGSLLGLGRVKLYVQQDIEGGLAMWEKLIAAAPQSPEAQNVRDELEALKSAHPGS
jgi:tetratricopeptide (TPR) repeat protein